MQKTEKPRLRIIPLGGVGEVGKNMTVFEWRDSIVVVDCGLMFPKEGMLGVDYVIPDTTYLEKNASKIKAFVITHGHEDHIGGLPYILNKFNAPIYGTNLTLALSKTKFDDNSIQEARWHQIKPGDRINCGSLQVEFIQVNHSIDGAVGLAIYSPEGIVVHTGDFKIDYTPIDGKVIDLNKFAELGKKGVLALLSDSTNAENPGYTISEKIVGSSFEKYFSSAKGRIIIATFASNIHRLQQVIDEAKRFNRKICLSGRSMLKIANVASELGYLKLPEKMLIRLDEIHKYRDNKLVILTTGSQGESMSGLVRMAAGEHPNLTIKQGDLVILSATPIPGNERYVSDVINMLYQRGAKVISGGMSQVHVSGHACKEELKLMLSIVKPKYFIPVHGEYRHLYTHAALAEELGIKNKDIFIPEIGRSIDMTSKSARFGDTVPSGIVMIDGLGIGDVGSVVLRDRKMLSSDGLFVIVLTISTKGKNIEIVAEPEILSRGFVYIKESEDLIEEAKQVIKRTVNNIGLNREENEWFTLKGKIRKSVSGFLYNKTKRSPMILPIVIEV